jgi:hypothetical protein
MISERVRIPPNHQRLIYAGKELQDEVLLSSYGLKKKDCLNLVGRLNAGGKRARATQGIDEDKDSMTESLRASITKQVDALDRGSAVAVRNFIDKVTAIDASMIAYNSAYFKEWLKSMPVKRLKRFQERLGENPSSKLDLRYVVISKEIFDEAVVQTQSLTTQLQTVNSIMNDVTRLVVLGSYADENGLVSWKAMTRDVSDVLEVKCREAGAAEALEQHARAMDA